MAGEGRGNDDDDDGVLTPGPGPGQSIHLSFAMLIVGGWDGQFGVVLETNHP